MSPDISNVMDKFPKAKSSLWLAQRLGNEVARRREIIRYRQLHRESLASGHKQQSGHHGFGDTATLTDTIVATTYQETNCFEPAPQAGQNMVNSQMSIFTSATSLLSLDEGETMGRRIPDLSDMSLDGVQLQYGEPFECPYCRTIQMAENRSEWK